MTRWRQAAEAKGWSLRETVIRLGRRAGGHVGTPSGLADKFAHFVRHRAIDGFNVSPYIIPHGLDDIVGMLVPALQERGVYPAEPPARLARSGVPRAALALGCQQPCTHPVGRQQRQTQRQREAPHSAAQITAYTVAASRVDPVGESTTSTTPRLR